MLQSRSAYVVTASQVAAFAKCLWSLVFLSATTALSCFGNIMYLQVCCNGDIVGLCEVCSSIESYLMVFPAHKRGSLQLLVSRLLVGFTFSCSYQLIHCPLFCRVTMVVGLGIVFNTCLECMYWSTSQLISFKACNSTITVSRHGLISTCSISQTCGCNCWKWKEAEWGKCITGYPLFWFFNHLSFISNTTNCILCVCFFCCNNDVTMT